MRARLSVVARRVVRLHLGLVSLFMPDPLLLGGLRVWPAFIDRALVLVALAASAFVAKDCVSGDDAAQAIPDATDTASGDAAFDPTGGQKVQTPQPTTAPANTASPPPPSAPSWT